MNTTVKNGAISVLIVEDEMIIALEIDSRLRDGGFNIIGRVSSSEDAVNAALTHRPDIIIMDIHIQGNKDGIDVSREIFNTYQPVVIFISAYTDDETRKKVSKVQPSYFLAKPIPYDDLTKIIRKSLSE